MDVKEHGAHNIPKATEHYDGRVFSYHDLGIDMTIDRMFKNPEQKKQQIQSQEISDYVPRSDLPGSEDN